MLAALCLNLPGFITFRGFLRTGGGGFLPATFNYQGDGSEFVYFAGLGLAWKITEKVDFTLAYGYSDLGEVATDYDGNGERLQAGLETNEFKLGMRFKL